MSSKKKPKKLRTPNITGIAARPPADSAALARRPEASEARLARADGARPVFDYTYVKKDLTRIGVLAGSFIAILVVLSFILN